MKHCFTLLGLSTKTALAVFLSDSSGSVITQQSLHAKERSVAFDSSEQVKGCDFSQSVIKGVEDWNAIINSPQWTRCSETMLPTTTDFKFPKLVWFQKFERTQKRQKFMTARTPRNSKSKPIPAAENSRDSKKTQSDDLHSGTVKTMEEALPDFTEESNRGGRTRSSLVAKRPPEKQDTKATEASDLIQGELVSARLYVFGNSKATPSDENQPKAYSLIAANRSEITGTIFPYFVQAKTILSGCQKTAGLDLACYSPLKKSIFQDLENFEPRKFPAEVAANIAKSIKSLYEYVRPMDVEATKWCIANRVESKNVSRNPDESDSIPVKKGTTDSETFDSPEIGCADFLPEKFIKDVDELFLRTQILRIESRNGINLRYLFDARITVKYAELGTLEAILMTEMGDHVNSQIIFEMFYDIIIMLRDSKANLRSQRESRKPVRNGDLAGMFHDIYE